VNSKDLFQQLRMPWLQHFIQLWEQNN